MLVANVPALYFYYIWIEKPIFLLLKY